jgi:outer membrane protein TolC
MKIILSFNRRITSCAVILLWIFLPIRLEAQDSITLGFCYLQAEKNYPLQRQLDILGSSNTLKVNNLNKHYLPQVNINGSASLQSDVTEVAIEFPSGMSKPIMPVLSKDWYKLTIDVNQVIYDGNVTNYQKKAEIFNLQADQKAVEIELYKLKDRINQIYFSIILMEQNVFLIKSNRKRIEAKLAEVQSGIRNGAILEMNADILRAELVRLDQQFTEAQADRTTSCKMLGELISYPVTESSQFVIPNVSLPNTDFENKRPESDLFNIQRSKTELMRNMVTTKWNPKLFAYGQVGYGRPSLNMLDNDFMPWWLFGAKLTWTPWNWNENKNEKQIITLQNDILRTQQETFEKNLRVSSQKDLGEILKFTEMISQDNTMIALREKITKTASSQLDNGVITSSDFISRLNEETQSRLNLEIHKIQLIKAKLSYLYTLGKL